MVDYNKIKHPIWQITNNNISSRNLIFLLLNARNDNRIESIIIIELKKIKVKLLLYDQPPFSIIASEPRWYELESFKNSYNSEAHISNNKISTTIITVLSIFITVFIIANTLRLV